MATEVKNLTGERYEGLTVISDKGEKGEDGVSIVFCKCNHCGKEYYVRRCNAKRAKSCGCKTNSLIGSANKKHGHRDTRLYRIWIEMRRRCRDSKRPEYKNYGGRGIKVCGEWDKNFMEFYEWAIDNGYSDDLTIDRNDVNGDYTPENCSWESMKHQQNNRRNNRMETINGETKTLSEWADSMDIKISSNALAYRIDELGMTGEDIIQPKIKNKNIYRKGEDHSKENKTTN